MTMTFLRLMKMPKIPMREQDRGDGQVVGQADRHVRAPPRRTLRTSIASPGARPAGDRLALDARLVAQRQHDRADHRDQQDQPGDLEEEDVAV
jgi:hypothetical protein